MGNFKIRIVGLWVSVSYDLAAIPYVCAYTGIRLFESTIYIDLILLVSPLFESFILSIYIYTSYCPRIKFVKSKLNY